MNIWEVPVGKPFVWKAGGGAGDNWVCEYWVKRTMHESWHKTWLEAYQFAFAQATA